MAAAGAMQPDLELDNFLRGLANLPKRSEEEGVPQPGMGMPPEQGAPPMPGQAPAPAPAAAPETNVFDQVGQGGQAEATGATTADAEE
jgi:hypothetical protein